ncbi:hypothetical protein PG996_010114 [Apiospora saccharicola]|uniref:SRR1-like domain-containing protein n=1 Tax=Apiospora saccharicola TaxID=335842 RepID=A0ABR1UQQ7_9PEZI
MPHSTGVVVQPRLERVENNLKYPKRTPKQQGEIQRLYDQAKLQYNQSSWSSSIGILLSARVLPTVTKIVSLGLGSLYEKSKDQPRRLKQLAMLLGLAEYLRSASTAEINIYAQDPGFTKADEALLRRMGVRVLKTTSPSDLGEAGRVIDGETLVYSPFLTIEAYELLLGTCTMGLLVGDDFNALRSKWEKRTAEHRQVEHLVKSGVSQYQKRSINGDGFWSDNDRPFPMALYSRDHRVRRQAGAKDQGSRNEFSPDIQLRGDTPRARL